MNHPLITSHPRWREIQEERARLRDLDAKLKQRMREMEAHQARVRDAQRQRVAPPPPPELEPLNGDALSIVYALRRCDEAEEALLARLADDLVTALVEEERDLLREIEPQARAVAEAAARLAGIAALARRARAASLSPVEAARLPRVSVGVAELVATASAGGSVIRAFEQDASAAISTR